MTELTISQEPLVCFFKLAENVKPVPLNLKNTLASFGATISSLVTSKKKAGLYGSKRVSLVESIALSKTSFPFLYTLYCLGMI